MKKLDDFMDMVDRRVDRKLGSFFRFFRSYFTYISTTVLMVLVLTFFGKLYHSQPYFVASVITSSLENIQAVMSDINQSCNILSVHEDHIVVDFLTTKSFEGSVIGGLNLAYPKKWRGPYTSSNPSFNGHFFEVVRALEGYFVVPGHGVKLPNNYVVGKDFTIDTKTSMRQLLATDGPLNYKGIKLAVPLTFKIGKWDSPLKMDDQLLKRANKYLKEFNDAMPFAKNENRYFTESAIIKRL
ncbi:hypothetical protein IPF37_02215 [bacterium]|nr:MAG: hypothetical protein IPF37_02215 [bacterium]